ncbi:MAG: cysteine desulfurase family protein [bacterium]|nr:cysteine desulfurase family protein [bacterium]
MIYLDYSATTPVDERVLDSFNKACLEFIGNPNSIHSLGSKSNELIKAATKQISDILGVKPSEIIYTSGASESNNTALKGICYKYKNRGKHIITTKYEHSSIYGPISYLQNEGFEIDFVENDEKGLVDIESLKNLIRDDTILVSITSVNSEIGIMNPIEDIANVLKNYPKIFFHVDMTQSIGKYKIDLSNIDLVSMSAHKIFGLKGIGMLIKKENIVLEPLIHGGKSTTIFRSGTPALPLIVSLAKALRLVYEKIEENYKYVESLNKYLVDNISCIDNVYINSNDKCSPYILNLSVIGVKPETMLHLLEQSDIYISTQTACSSNNSLSKAVLYLTNNEDRAKSSIRISLSYKTTKQELEKFISIFKESVKRLTNLR